MKNKIFKIVATGNYYRIVCCAYDIWYKEVTAHEFRAKMNAKQHWIKPNDFELKIASGEYEMVKPKQRFSTICKNAILPTL